MLPASRLGKHANPSAIKLMPATRLITTAAPETSAPISNRMTSEGKINRASPVAASLAAARASTFFIHIAFFHTAAAQHESLAASASHSLLISCFPFERDDFGQRPLDRL
jgi:hypothetical protein